MVDILRHSLVHFTAFLPRHQKFAGGRKAGIGPVQSSKTSTPSAH